MSCIKTGSYVDTNAFAPVFLKDVETGELKCKKNWLKFRGCSIVVRFLFIVYVYIYTYVCVCVCVCVCAYILVCVCIAYRVMQC